MFIFEVKIQLLIKTFITMKQLIILTGFILLLIPSTVNAQKKYFDLNFEKTNSDSKNILFWKYQSIGTEFFVDSTSSSNGKNSLYVNLKHTDLSGGVPFYFILPKVYYQGLRTIDISVKIMFRNEKPNAGLWCSIKKDSELLGCASTYKGNVPITVVPIIATAGNPVPVIPYTWTSYNFEIKCNKDPNEVIIGLILVKDRAWFDDVEIKINGKPINNLAFEISADN